MKYLWGVFLFLIFYNVQSQTSINYAQKGLPANCLIKIGRISDCRDYNIPPDLDSVASVLTPAFHVTAGQLKKIILLPKLDTAALATLQIYFNAWLASGWELLIRDSLYQSLYSASNDFIYVARDKQVWGLAETPFRLVNADSLFVRDAFFKHAPKLVFQSNLPAGILEYTCTHAEGIFFTCSLNSQKFLVTYPNKNTAEVFDLSASLDTIVPKIYQKMYDSIQYPNVQQFRRTLKTRSRYFNESDEMIIQGIASFHNKIYISGLLQTIFIQSDSSFAVKSSNLVLVYDNHSFKHYYHNPEFDTAFFNYSYFAGNHPFLADNLIKLGLFVMDKNAITSHKKALSWGDFQLKDDSLIFKNYTPELLPKRYFYNYQVYNATNTIFDVSIGIKLYATFPFVFINDSIQPLPCSVCQTINGRQIPIGLLQKRPILYSQPGMYFIVCAKKIKKQYYILTIQGGKYVLLKTKDWITFSTNNLNFNISDYVAIQSDDNRFYFGHQQFNLYKVYSITPQKMHIK